MPEQPELPEPPAEEETLPEPIVCDACFERNLTENVHIQQCVACDENYCVHFASVIDASQCRECMSDVTVTFATVEKTTVHTQADGTKSQPKTRKARQITIGGLHWLFAQRKINDLSDAELSCSIEYHHAMLSSLVYERDKRRAEHLHRNAGKSFKTTSAKLDSTVISETTTVKSARKVRVTKPKAAEVNIMSMFESLISSGMSKEEIKAMLLGAKK